MELKSKVYKKKIPVPIFFGDLEIIISKYLSDAALKCSEYNISTTGSLNDYGAFVMIRREKSGSKVYGVFLGPKCSAGLIAHEANHIKNYIFSEIGQKPDIHNDEVESYLIGWITNQICKFYKGKEKLL